MAEVRSVLFFSRQERIDAIRCSFSRRVVQSLVVLHRSLFPPVFVCVHANGEQRPIVLLLSKFHSDDSSSYRSRSIQLLRFEETEQRQVVLFNCTYIYIYCIMFFNFYIYVLRICTIKLILSIASHCQRFVLFSTCDTQQAAFQSVSERVSCM